MPPVHAVRPCTLTATTIALAAALAATTIALAAALATAALILPDTRTDACTDACCGPTVSEAQLLGPWLSCRI